MEYIVYDITTKKILAYGQPPWVNQASFVNHNMVEVDKVKMPKDLNGYNVFDVGRYDIVKKELYVDTTAKDLTVAKKDSDKVIADTQYQLAKTQAIKDGTLNPDGTVGKPK
jgi:hypothetical protein